MIKRIEIVNTSKSADEILSKVKNDMNSYPSFSWSIGKYFKEFEKMVEKPQRFVGGITNNKIEFGTKGLKYWPQLVVDLESTDSGTKLRLTYKLYWVYLLTYCFLLFMLLLNLIPSIIYGVSSPNESIGAILSPFIFFIALPLYGRWMQKNIIKYLTN
jgi:hypothetical protein